MAGVQPPGRNWEHVGEQFDAHVRGMEEGGISFPARGMGRFGESVLPVTEGLHHLTEGRGGRTNIDSDIYIADERDSTNAHLLSVSSVGGQVTGAIFHPARGRDVEDAAGSGAMRYRSEDNPSTWVGSDDLRKGDRTFSRLDEFSRHVSEAVRDAPFMEEEGGRFGNGGAVPTSATANSTGNVGVHLIFDHQSEGSVLFPERGGRSAVDRYEWDPSTDTPDRPAFHGRTLENGKPVGDN